MRVQKVCTVEGCDKKHKARGLCAPHYKELRRTEVPPCTMEDCDRPSTAKGLCSAHYKRLLSWGDPSVVKKVGKYPDDAACGVDGCTDVVESMGLCNRHYQRLRKHGDPNVVFSEQARKGQYGDTCTIAGCDGRHEAHGYCRAHYQRYHKTGDPEGRRSTPAPNGFYGDTCTVDGCESPHIARGYCIKHYQRWQKHGDPNVLQYNARKDDSPSLVYIIEHRAYGAAKVGVGTEERVRQHTSRGWEAVWVSPMMTRLDAMELEQRLLQVPGVLGFLGKEEMPQNGATETFDSSDLPNVLAVVV